jgi:hypothetical protein
MSSDSDSQSHSSASNDLIHATHTPATSISGSLGRFQPLAYSISMVASEQQDQQDAAERPTSSASVQSHNGKLTNIILRNNLNTHGPLESNNIPQLFAYHFGRLETESAETKQQLTQMNSCLSEVQDQLGEVNGRLGEVNGRLGELEGIHNTLKGLLEMAQEFGKQQTTS